MQISDEDIDAIVTAVEMLLDGTLSTVHIANDGELIFSAHYDGAELIIDPEVMAPELAEHLLRETALGGDPQPAPSDPKAESDDTADQSSSTRRPKGQPVPA